MGMRVGIWLFSGHFVQNKCKPVGAILLAIFISAKRGIEILHDAIARLPLSPSDRPSVCPSVTLVDQDHIGWTSWKLIAGTLSPTPSLFVAQTPPT